jgi:hypothetical protein
LFLGRPRLEHVDVSDLLEVGIAEHEVLVPRRHLRQLVDRHLVGVREVGQILRQFVVETHLLLVDQLQQQRRNVRDRDSAIAEVHVGRGRHSRHRLALGGRHDLLAIDGHAEDDGPQVGFLHVVANDLHDRVGLHGVGALNIRRPTGIR